MPGLNKRASNQTETTSTKMEDINEKEKVTIQMSERLKLNKELDTLSRQEYQSFGNYF